ncbi:PAS and ANTAR domain-containing protein [Nakamurella deserti]|uniref:PAS and ANTAR domain-containing protein n=1 Tax=Nakamurella deserti TaxID=2164074 RepID=UPI001300B5F0|nr:PAS and ANTAR domain-containing protein [Nakamurella deserti]
MDNRIQPVIAAMAGGEREQLGWFDYDLTTDVWTWSATLYRIHGFEPGEIVPTTAIFVSHKHPEDRSHTDEVLAAVLETGQPFCCRHRIITSRREVRTVVTIGQGTLDDTGRVTKVTGYFVDITDAATAVSQQAIRDAVAGSAAARAQIEQAKGALMIVQGVSADDAFAILRWHSSHANVKLRDLAQLIVDAIQQPYTGTDDANQRLGRLLSGVVDGSVRPERGIAATPVRPVITR